MIFELSWIPQTPKSNARIDVYGAHSNGKYLIGAIDQGALNLGTFWDHYQKARTYFADLSINVFEPEGLHEERIAVILGKVLLQKAGVHANTQQKFDQLKSFAFDMVKSYIKDPEYTPKIAPEFKVA